MTAVFKLENGDDMTVFNLGIKKSVYNFIAFLRLFHTKFTFK